MNPQTDRKPLQCSKKKGSHVGAVPNVLGEDFQGDGLGVVPVFSLKDPTGAKEKGSDQNKSHRTI